MASVAGKLLTAEEFFDWANRPENRHKAYELNRGEIEEMPSPTVTHGVVCGLVARLLGNYTFDRGYGFVCTNDSGLIVERNPDTVRGPDVMLFDEEVEFGRLPHPYAELVPRLIVEVLSPSDQTSEVNRRVSQYLYREVPLVWLVDSELACVTVYQPGQNHIVLDNSDELTFEELLPGFRCRVVDLFTTPKRLSLEKPSP
jgi:Uma2 family endonuclease